MSRSSGPYRLLRLGLLALVVLGVTTRLSKAASPTPAEEYLALVDAYRAGDTRAAAEALSNHDDKWIEAAHAVALKTAASWPAGRAEAGVLLHTESVTGGWVLPSHVPLHLGAARRLLAVARGASLNRFRHDWLLAVCWHFQSDLDLGALLPWVDELRDAYGNDAVTDLVTGRFYEAVGWSAASGNALPWSNRSRTLSAMPRHTQTEALDAAADSFERAARQATTHDEASVRLGHVLAELGRADDARLRLAPLIEGAGETRWRYLAALFTARAEARGGHEEAEAAAYTTAAAIMPACQTPRVGLTALRRRQGDTAQAASLARALTTDEDRRCDDPWWFYRLGTSPEQLPELLEQMRREFAS
jgi:hypothetical protein